MDIAQKIEQNIPLAQFTTFRIGGPAKLFVEVDTSEELVEAIRWAKAKGEKYFVLGGGSNLLISDQGYNGLVIKNESSRLFRSKAEDGEAVECDAGLPMARLVLSAARHGLAGLEWAAGLPGTVGGAIRGNAGCFGSDMAASTVEVTAYNPSSDQVSVLDAGACGFAYRSSLFKEQGLVVLSAKLKLKYGQEEAIGQEMARVAKARAERQPKGFSAGSVFKNVPLAEVTDQELIKEARQDGKISGAGAGTLPAAWLIEKLYFKGKVVGGAKVSEDHANFIMNEQGKATAADVLMLLSLIKQKVRVEFGVQLKEELTYLDY